jgi:hypothetical protein
MQEFTKRQHGVTKLCDDRRLLLMIHLVRNIYLIGACPSSLNSVQKLARPWRLGHLWLQFVVWDFCFAHREICLCASAIYFILLLAPPFSLSVQPLYISVRDCVIPRGAVSLLRRKVAARSSGKRISLFRSYPLRWNSSVLLCVYCLLFPYLGVFDWCCE